MIKVDLSWVAHAVSGRFNAPLNSAIHIDQVSTDTRTLQPGALYIALAGEQFDGHAFLAEAAAKGAVAAIVQQVPETFLNTEHAKGFVCIEVENTTQALGELARAVRAYVQPKIVAITGSSGKTTVKEMVATVLKYHWGEQAVLATQGNFNNEIGVPLTLLRLTEAHQYAVVELGANHAGEIAYTVDLCRPSVALINNISAAHVEGFGSLAGVAQAKSEIFEALSADGIAIYPFDCEFKEQFQAKLAQQGTVAEQQKQFSLTAQDEADYWVTGPIQACLGKQQFNLCYAAKKNTPKIETAQINLPFMGAHHRKNVLAATACCIAMGVPLPKIAAALATMKPVPGRLSIQQVSAKHWLIDDSYNANLGSALAALEVLQQCPGRQVFILADMGELGEDSAAYHAQVGQAAKDLGIHEVWTVGELSQATTAAFYTDVAAQAQTVHHFPQKEGLQAALQSKYFEETHLEPISFLVKGSRRMQMETLCQFIQTQGTNISKLTKNEGESHAYLAE